MQHPGSSLPQFQQFHTWLDQEKGFTSELWLNTLLLQVEVGELTKEVLTYRWAVEKHGQESPQVATVQADLGAELADCLAYLLKIANDAGLDLQEAYTAKMLRNIERTWR